MESYQEVRKSLQHCNFVNTHEQINNETQEIKYLSLGKLIKILIFI